MWQEWNLILMWTNQQAHYQLFSTPSASAMFFHATANSQIQRWPKLLMIKNNQPTNNPPSTANAWRTHIQNRNIQLSDVTSYFAATLMVGARKKHWYKMVKPITLKAFALTPPPNPPTHTQLNQLTHNYMYKLFAAEHILIFGFAMKATHKKKKEENAEQEEVA